jgi:hypothetical protein
MTAFPAAEAGARFCVLSLLPLGVLDVHPGVVPIVGNRHRCHFGAVHVGESGVPIAASTGVDAEFQVTDLGAVWPMTL